MPKTKPPEGCVWAKNASGGWIAVPKSSAHDHDPVDHPSHYVAGGIETIDYIEAKQLNYHLGNAVKYISRAGLKNNAVEDLKKARWYLSREIARLTDTES